ncbi:MAG: polyprenyl synthetase family protein [Pseudomonadota bacterium]
MTAVPSARFSELKDRCDAVLVGLLGHGNSEFAPEAGPHLVRLFEASAYALTRGGKRIRPLLVYAAAEAINSDSLAHPESGAATALDYVACAAEMLHAYSLVHDDLPAMDDDDLRRGQPTTHIAFDEATAILVGDGLQARALELLTDAPGLDAETRLRLVRTLSAAGGVRGMVGGQAIDIGAVDQAIDVAHLETMHALKTGALIRASVMLGGLTAGADDESLSALDDYADAIGLAFQVCDDILDATGDSKTLGKEAGADAAHHKPTYVSLHGLDGAKAKAEALLIDAKKALKRFGNDELLLAEIADFIVHRDR